MTDEYIPDDDWATIISNVPVVSVDLVIQVDDGVLLGQRTNKPARGEWFVPGGRVEKQETLREAVHRVAHEELGADIKIIKNLGAYEHFYDTADVAAVDGKHYVANGFVVHMSDSNLLLDDQHGKVRVFQSEDLPDLHPYVQAYLEDANIILTD